MDSRKVCFIIYYDDELYLQECIDYISFLKIPEGIDTDIITISEVNNIAEGYNAAMQSSDAKYKVYLKQNVFIVNENFIEEAIGLFNRYPEYGMFGVMGSDAQVEGADYHNNWNVGMKYICDALSTRLVTANNPDEMAEVAAVDGMLLITQYDIPWRNDVFDGFDFFDISQSIEFVKAGYKVGVPHQADAWCLFDMTEVEAKEYDYYRESFCEVYKSLGYKYIANKNREYNSKLNEEIEKLLPILENNISFGRFNEAVSMIKEALLIAPQNIKLRNLHILIQAILLEQDAKIENGFANLNNMVLIYNRFNLVKFLIRRLEFDKPIEVYAELLNWIFEDDNSPLVAVQEFLCHFAMDKMKVVNRFANLREGNDTVDGEKEEEKYPLVTVLTSVYNAEGFLEDTLRSVMNQTYKNLQIIVVDDCSTDRSREIIDRLACEDSRIQKVYMKKNSHICKASNVGYRHAEGKYIALIGHDDIWKEDKIEKQVQFMELNPKYAVSFTLVDLIDGNKQICNRKREQLYNVFNKCNYSQKEWIRHLFYVSNAFCAPSAMIRKICLKEESLYQLGLIQVQDWALWMDILLDYPVYILRERLTLYRQFLDDRKNLSDVTTDTVNRLRHEMDYMNKRFINCISDMKLIEYFGEDFVNPESKTLEELKCERAFLLKKINNYYCIDMFMQLYEDERTRRILENVFNFGLIDFYAVNTKSFNT